MSERLARMRLPGMVGGSSALQEYDNCIGEYSSMVDSKSLYSRNNHRLEASLLLEPLVLGYH